MNGIPNGNGSNRLVWIAITVLSTAVIAMGGIIYRSVDGRMEKIETEQARVRGVVSDRGDRIGKLEVLVTNNTTELKEISRKQNERTTKFDVIERRLDKLERR